MKKLIALILAAVMVLGLVACGGSSAPAATEAAPAATEAPAVEMTAEEKADAQAEIRLALGLLLDRNYIVEQVAQGGQTPAATFVASGMTEPDGSEFYMNSGDSDEFVGYYDQ